MTRELGEILAANRDAQRIASIANTDAYLKETIDGLLQRISELEEHVADVDARLEDVETAMPMTPAQQAMAELYCGPDHNEEASDG